MSKGCQKKRLDRLLGIELGKRVFAAIESIGGEARYVGGAVRDVFHHQPLSPPPDLDMAMDVAPVEAEQALKKCGLVVLPTGIDHGTITVFDRQDDSVKIELTSLRHDVETDGRHAVVAFGKDWAEDAARRDFTINSIYLSANGDVFDPFDGRADLGAGRVRFIGNPAERLAEDHLRILRFFRFFARFGQGEADKAAMQAISESAQSLDKISGERIAKELAELLLTPSALTGLRALQEAGVDKILTSGGFDLSCYQRLIEVADDAPLPALLASLVDDHQPFAEKLKLSGKMRTAMAYLDSGIGNLDEFSTDDWPQAAYRIKPDFSDTSGHEAAKWLAFRYAIGAGRTEQGIEENVFNRLAAWEIPSFPVQGRDLLALGYKKGQILGKALAELEEYWIQGQFSCNKDDLLAHAKTKAETK